MNAKKTTKRPAPPTPREVCDLLGDALAANAALTPEQRALLNAAHDLLSAATAVCGGSVSPWATQEIRNAGDRAHAAAVALVVRNRRAA